MEMTAKELIDLIKPEHERTSCNDTDLANGFYSNDGNTRCSRCTLLEILKTGKLPDSHSFLIVCHIEDKLANEETKNHW